MSDIQIPNCPICNTEPKFVLIATQNNTIICRSLYCDFCQFQSQFAARKDWAIEAWVMKVEDFKKNQKKEKTND